MKLLATTLVLLVAAATFAATGKISGTVVDKSGSPVKHITVEAVPLDSPPADGIFPHGVSDQRGRFAITVPLDRLSPGEASSLRWLLYPYQESRYYPDLVNRFYDTAGERTRIVTLSSAKPQASVQLKLGRRAGALKMEVKNAATGILVRSSRCTLDWAEDPSRALKIRVSGGLLTVLLPSNTNLRLTLSSDGYRRWTYPGAINVGPGHTMMLDVHLQPARAR